MRFYDISIGGGRWHYTSFVNGRNDPGALLVEMDLPVVDFATPVGGGFLKVWGISIEDYRQASAMNQQPISIQGGMKPGLPLATAVQTQAGTLLNATVQQAFGNWQGTTMTLDLLLTQSAAASSSTNNLSFSWPKGTAIGDAIKQALSTAYPGVNVSVKLKQNLVFPEDQHGFYANAVQFAQWVKQISKSIANDPKYQGISITQNGQAFSVFDGSSPGTPKAIAFTDLIGQPAWSEFQTINFKTMMRSDLQVGSLITMPQTVNTVTTADSYSQYRQSSVLQGTFGVRSLRHVGNSRQPQADAWVTVIEAYQVANGGQ